MLTSQIINQTPNPIIKIKRLQTEESKAASYTQKYDEKTQAAYDVITGKYGSGAARKAAVKSAGYDYSEIQTIVNNAGGKVENLVKVSVPSETKTYTDTIVKVRTFSPSEGEKVLQSYQFSLSKDSVDGSFSLTFFPESAGGSSLFDDLQILDIVEIYETKQEHNTVKTITAGKTYDYTKLPVFVGIIKSKKYVSQMADSGAIRRLSVSGIAVTGLISQFYINLDTTAVAISKQIVESESISRDLTLGLLKKNNPVKDVLSRVWASFCNIAESCGTVAIKYLIEQTMGSDFFDCDTSKFKYPLANVLKAEQTQDFYSIIDGIIPEPLYEKFACTDFETGKMKIKIRQVPFRRTGDGDCEKDSSGTAVTWVSAYNREIVAEEVKYFDLSQNDNEVYTVFFSYLNGYPINTDKLMRIIALEDSLQNKMIKFNDKKYRIYGYRPLIVSFNGYGNTEGEDDTETDANLAKTNERLSEWFGRLDDMLSGTITLAMTYDNTKKTIMPGEVVGFLGGQFYVEGVTHSWTYGGNGEISLSVSRGGKYTNTGAFSVLTDFTKNAKLLESSINTGGRKR
jgi:hypothetical protein